MLNFHEHATANNCNTIFRECQVKPDNHQIPFSFVHTTKELYDKGLDLSDIGMYNVLASYLNFNAVVDMEGEKYLRGITVVVSQEKLACRGNTSVRTVQRKIDRLVALGEVKLHKSYKGCYQYELTAYPRAIEKKKQALAEQKKRCEEAQQRRKRDAFSGANPFAPAPEQVDAYLRQEQEKKGHQHGRPHRAQQSSRQQGNGAKHQSHQQPKTASQQATQERTAIDPHGHFGHQAHATESPHEPTHDIFASTYDILTHIIELLRSLKEQTLSSGDDAKNEESGPKSADDKEERVHEEEWKNYEKYAQAFYGTIRSKKFKKEVCLYFKGKVDEFGFASDGTDRTLQVIMKVKVLGCRVHTVMDKEFGVRAYNMVLDEEETRIRRKRDEEQKKAKQEKQHAHAENLHEPKQEGEESHKDSSSPDPREHHPSANSESAETTPDPADDPDDPRDEILDLRELWKMAPQVVRRVVGTLENRINIHKAVDWVQPYTPAEIEAIWQNAYHESGWPKKAGEWFHHRILVHEILKAKRLVEAMSNEEALELLERAKAYERTWG